jgi:hypothetical protein
MKPPPFRLIPGRRPASSSSETALHIACAGWLSMRLIPPTFFTTFPAGGGGRERGTRLKRMGLKPGMPDILIFDRHIDGNILCPLVYGIELKSEDGRVSVAQRQTHGNLLSVGVPVSVVRSLDDLRSAVIGWDIPIKSVTPAQERLQSVISSWQTGDWIDDGPDVED